MTSTLELLRNYDQVVQRISELLERYSRPKESVTLVAVSKKKSSELIRTLFEHRGQVDFGENYAQEFSAKAEELVELQELRWHFIGRLQSNKIRLIAKWADVIHCLESLEQIRRVDRCLAEDPRRRQTGCFLAYNMGADEAKSGVKNLEELQNLKDAIVSARLSRVSLVGVMGIPPLAWAEESLEFVTSAYQTWIEQAHSVGLKAVSLGMTGDLEAAIAAGSTHLRIGSAIFGDRA